MTEAESNPYPKTKMGRAISSFWDFTSILTGSGTWKIRPMQQALVDALLPALDESIRKLLEQQLVQPYYMQFWHGGRVSPFYFKNFNLPKELRIPDPSFADRLYKIEMFVDGRKQWAHVTFCRGRIHCLEFKKPFKFYKGKEVRFGAVSVGKTRHSFTGSIDRKEHGKGGVDATGEEG